MHAPSVRQRVGSAVGVKADINARKHFAKGECFGKVLMADDKKLTIIVTRYQICGKLQGKKVVSLCTSSTQLVAVVGILNTGRFASYSYLNVHLVSLS